MLKTEHTYNEFLGINLKGIFSGNKATTDSNNVNKAAGLVPMMGNAVKLKETTTSSVPYQKHIVNKAAASGDLNNESIGLKTEKSANTLAGVKTGVEIAGTIATVIAGISNNKERAKTEAALSNLSAAQQKELNEKFIKAKTQNDKLRIILETAQLQNSNAQKVESGKQLGNVLLLATISAVTLGILYLATRKKHQAVQAQPVTT